MKKILFASVAVFALSIGAPAMADSFFHPNGGGNNGGGNNTPPPVVTPVAPTSVNQSATNSGPTSNTGNNSGGGLHGNFTVQANTASGATNSFSKTVNNAVASSSCACGDIGANVSQTAVNSGATSNTGVNTTNGGSLTGVAAAQVNSASGASNSVSTFTNVASSGGWHH
jgi:hypothetical protein